MSARALFLGTLAAALLCGATILLGERHAFAETALKADPSVAEINPKALGAVKVVGSGFKPEDRIQVSLLAANKGSDVPVASAEADASGAFETTLNGLSVLQGVLNYRFKDGKPTPDPENPPIPAGTYTLKAVSWDSGLQANCSLELKAPTPK